MNELVSIIVPVFNVSQYLPTCIKSLLAQTYHNIEIILVDDGSIDCSGELCDDYAKKDGRILVIHQKNHGVTYAREKGVECSKGQWILFVDGDDELKPNAVSFFLKQAYDYDVDMIISPQLVRYGEILKQSKFYCEGKLSQREYCRNISLQFFNGGIGGKFWKKKLYYKGVFDISSKIKNNEDYLMNLRLSKHMQSVYCNAHDALYIYNLHENSASHTRLTIESWSILYDELINCSSLYFNYPILFLLSSMDHRFATGEINKHDIKRYAIKINLPVDAPCFFYVMKKYQTTFNFSYKVLYKVMRRIYQSFALFKTYII